MKVLLLTSLLIFNGVLFAQFTDDFSDGDFTNNPTWSGDDADYEVTPGFQLHLSAPAVTDVKYLSTPSQAIDNATWEFWARISVNPSGSNYSEVYLTSNTPNLKGSLNGYFVRIGGSDDEVSLFRQTGTTQTKIIDGVDGIVSLNDNELKVRVTRDNSGNWELLADTSAALTGYVSQGTVADNDHVSSLFSGVVCTFTSTRNTAFYFDDFVVTGTGTSDVIAPIFQSVTVTSPNSLEVYFDEPLDVVTAENVNNYLVDGGVGNPTNAVLDPSTLSMVSLTFGTNFNAGTHHDITVNNVEDLSANVMATTVRQFIYYVPATPNYREVVINELMIKENPRVNLPEEEYIELHNTSATKIFDLAGWTLSNGTTTSTLPTYDLLPGEYVIVVRSSNLGAFGFYTNKVGTNTWPSLTNAAGQVTLTDGTSTIDYMEYVTAQAYAGTDKADGGWSLEQVNPSLPCFNQKNWKPTTNSNGGTPGAINSVDDNTADTDAPEIEDIVVLNNSQIEIYFNEAVEQAHLHSGSITISGGRTVSGINVLAPTYKVVTLTISPVLDTAVIYTIQLDSVVDCSGNLATASGDFVLAHLSEPGDLVINEILFNPFTGGSDFVEVHNVSNKYVDIYGWSLNNEASRGDSIMSHKVISPGGYLAISGDILNVKTEYLTHNPRAFVEIPDLPSYNNGDGEVYLYCGLDESDYFQYDEDMHFPLLKNVKGVSLERLDAKRETNDRGNWHSAAENVGFATPGMPNSQLMPTVITGEELSIHPEIFSPDNDGYEDVLNITYQLDEPGYVGRLIIYDSYGRKVKVLFDNELLATEGIFTWDGTDDNFAKARMGTYVLFFEVYNAQGTVKAIKKTCVLAHRLNR